MVKLSVTCAMGVAYSIPKEKQSSQMRAFQNYASCFGHSSPSSLTAIEIQENREIYRCFIGKFGESATFEEALQVCIEKHFSIMTV